MDYHTIFLILLPVIVTWITFHILFPKPDNQAKPQPPAPKPWPIIGHIHLLGDKPHRSITKLSKLHGPIMSLKLGNITTIVISSPCLARELFTNYDLACSRHVRDAVTASDHDKLSLPWLPICPRWRNLRKITVLQLFSNHKLDATQSLRQKKVEELVEFARTSCGNGQVIDIGKAAFTTSLNLLSNTFFSIDLCCYDKLDSQEFKDLVWRFMDVAARPNVSDFFPLLRPLDLQGIRRMSEGYVARMIGIFEEIIEGRLNDTIGSKNDVLTTLLKLVDDKELCLDEVKHVLLDLFVAGTDTTSVTIEWAMTELLCHPEMIKKAQAELQKVVPKDKLVEESNMPKLPYLSAIIKETLRLHPGGPFLLPRKTLEDIQLNNCYVPEHAQLLINVWSISRDPNIWENAESFIPERFLDSDIDFKGQHYEFLIFGAGRRICPGLALANRMLHLMLGNLLHWFNWKLPNGMNQCDMDMDEKFGLTLQKSQPLQAIPYTNP